MNDMNHSNSSPRRRRDGDNGDGGQEVESNRKRTARRASLSSSVVIEMGSADADAVDGGGGDTAESSDGAAERGDCGSNDGNGGSSGGGSSESSAEKKPQTRARPPFPPPSRRGSASTFGGSRASFHAGDPIGGSPSSRGGALPKPSSYEAILRSALSNAGRHSYGVVAIEVWSLDSHTQRLDRVPGGYWRCPCYPVTDAVSKLEDANHPRYMPPVPLQPGVGFVGSLWAEGSYQQDYVEWRDLRAMILDPEQPRIPRTECLAEAFGFAAGMPFRVGHGALEAKGVVVYFTRHTVRRDAVSTETNLRFLRSATDMIGSIGAFRDPRERAVEDRAARTGRSFRSVAAKLQVLAMFRRAGSMAETVAKEDEFRDNDVPDLGGRKKSRWGRSKFVFGGGGGRDRRSSFRRQNSPAGGGGGDGGPSDGPPCGAVCRDATCGAFRSVGSCCSRRAQSAASKLDDRRSAWLTKVRGGDILPPPGLPGREALFALFGILLCLMALSGANEAIQRWGGHDRSMILSAFGGLVVNLFCLPASPNSQPRNCFFGLTINVLVGMAFRRIPSSVLPLWVRGAISPAVSISAMAYLGYIHPPAGGAAVAFALGKEDEWLEVGLLLLGWTLSVTFAALYNNLSEKRSYPTYWRFLWMPDALYRRVHKCRKKWTGRAKIRREQQDMMNELVAKREEEERQEEERQTLAAQAQAPDWSSFRSPGVSP